MCIGSTALLNSSAGNGADVILLENLTCSGNEVMLFDCTFDETVMGECINRQTSNVTCGISSNCYLAVVCQVN